MNTNVPTKDLKKITIYPPAWAVQIVGATSPQLNRGISILARAILDALAGLTERFSRKEWLLLHQYFHGLELDPGVYDPGEFLMAQLLQRAAEDNETGEGPIRTLAGRLRLLSYLEAHALVQCVQSVVDPEEREWWTPETFRRRRSRKR